MMVIKVSCHQDPGGSWARALIYLFIFNRSYYCLQIGAFYFCKRLFKQLHNLFLASAWLSLLTNFSTRLNWLSGQKSLGGLESIQSESDTAEATWLAGTVQDTRCVASYPLEGMGGGGAPFLQDLPSNKGAHLTSTTVKTL